MLMKQVAQDIIDAGIVAAGIGASTLQTSEVLQIIQFGFNMLLGFGFLVLRVVQLILKAKADDGKIDAKEAVEIAENILDGTTHLLSGGPETHGTENVTELINMVDSSEKSNPPSSNNKNTLIK